MKRDGLLALLMHAFSPPISLRISPERFEFVTRYRVESIAPVLYLTGAGEKHVISAVGDWVVPAHSTRFALLDTRAKPPPPLTRHDALEAFLRYGIAITLKRKIVLRPTVTVHGVESIAGAFEGRETHVLRQALVAAGAHDVVFAQEPAV